MQNETLFIVGASKELATALRLLHVGEAVSFQYPDVVCITSPYSDGKNCLDETDNPNVVAVHLHVGGSVTVTTKEPLSRHVQIDGDKARCVTTYEPHEVAELIADRWGR